MTDESRTAVVHEIESHVARNSDICRVNIPTDTHQKTHGSLLLFAIAIFIRYYIHNSLLGAKVDGCTIRQYQQTDGFRISFFFIARFIAVYGLPTDCREGYTTD